MILRPHTVMANPTMGYPIIYNVVISFQDVHLGNMRALRPFVGIANYRAILDDPTFLEVTSNAIDLVTAIVVLLVGLLLALFVNLDIPGAGWTRGTELEAGSCRSWPSLPFSASCSSPAAGSLTKSSALPASLPFRSASCRAANRRAGAAAHDCVDQGAVGYNPVQLKRNHGHFPCFRHTRHHSMHRQTKANRARTDVRREQIGA